MSYEDRPLNCVQCGKEFTFTSGEQEFYEQKGFTSDPKRCKDCRTARRKGVKQQGGGIYRSPAFENSAPAHQKIRDGRKNASRSRVQNGYRAPAAFGRRARTGDYRSPAFRGQGKLSPEKEYRAPGFREYSDLKPEEEYRAPGFQEYAKIDMNDEYRAPAYRDLAKQYQDEKPLFEISCKRCGEIAMVPFLPEEREESFCKECYTLIRAENEALRKRALEEAAEEAALEPDANVAGMRDDDLGITHQDEGAE